MCRIAIIALLAAAATGATADAGPPYHTGKIMPTPQQVSYADRYMPVYHIGKRRPLATVMAGDLPAEQLAAEDLVARICALADLEEPNYEPRVGIEEPPGGNVICLAAPWTSPACAILAAKPGLAVIPRPHGAQAYAIRWAERGERLVCIAAGGGPMGSTFAGASLRQLLKVEDGRVWLRMARVDDWPQFEMRGTCCYTPEEAAWLALCKFSTQDMNYGSHGRDAWMNPDAMGRPVNWGKYDGAGRVAVSVARENPHSGDAAVQLRISDYYEQFEDRPHYINGALMVGNTNGYRGPNALPAAPGRYRMCLWMRGDVPWVNASVLMWTSQSAPMGDRVEVPCEPPTIRPTSEWREYELSFELPESAVTFAPKLGITGHQDEGYEIGSGFVVDDLVITREESDENLFTNGDAEQAEKPYTSKIEAMWDWCVPRGLWPIQFVNPLYVSNWEYDGELKIQVSDPAQIDALADTFRISLDRGGKWVMLALDDFASRLGGPAPHYVITNEADREAFDSLGECHGTLVQQLYQRLKQTHPQCRLIVCPAYYWTPNGAYEEEGNRYLRTFGEMVPEDVLIVWTGPQVRSRTITEEDVERFSWLIGRKPYLWDNTIYARHANPTYVLDPFTSEYPDDFHDMLAGGLHNNGGVSELYLTGCLVYGDYAWNPDAYDAQASIDHALEMVLGPGCAADGNAFREHYFAVRDPYIALTNDLSALSADEIADRIGPLSAERVAEIVAHVEAMDAALSRLQERSPNEALLAELEALAAPLRASAARLKELGSVSATVREIDGGVVVPESAFVGGTGHRVYGNGCEPRRATWIYGQGTSVHTMEAIFTLSDPPAEATLVLVGQDHDKEGATDVAVILNGETLHEGPNELGKRGWYEWKIALPSGILRDGANTLTIRNLESSDSMSADWIMLSEAQLLFD